MAGLLPHQLAAGGISPEEVFADPYMQQSNPIVDLLIAYLSQTDPEMLQSKGQRLLAQKGEKRSAPSPTPQYHNRMRETKGPIQANKPRQIASQRDRIMREIDGY